ncbi:Fic family protein [Hymenobacter negativus]|uniref:Fic family protein n=1 Tax=Hymenobacter negativus TaxID=2795026 RepID=A0ABS3QJU1_9BACT|nr:Fic family protein [Hymenobacter negativus]MBO2011520.1 Fic family protein [Hymenobacter negativus]
MPLFTEINRLKADLDGLRPLAPEQEQRVLQKFRLEWNYNSNAIEGNSLTLGETRSLLLHGLTAAGKPMRDHLDIKGHNEAVLWLEDFVRDERPLTEQFIRGMHEVLLGEAYYTSAQTATGQPTRKMIVPGQYKQQPNNVLTATGEMFYFASPEDTPAQMRDLVDWYRQEETAPTMHPVALAAEFHYRFVRIHPFDDGNGRMSRLLMNLILLRHGYPMTVIKATDRNRYLAALSAADAGDPEPFLRFIIENVEAGLQLMIRAAKGESIDEPDDLDKKLALLKKQVLSREDAITNIWSKETQSEFYNLVFSFWQFDFTQQMERFYAFFLHNESAVGVHAEGIPEGIHGVSPQLAFDNEVLLKSAYIWFSLKEFRQLNNTFSLIVRLSFAFNKTGFIVSLLIGTLPLSTSDNEEPIFSSLYKSEYDHARIHDLNYQLANKVYDFIAAKVAEADTPPA